MRHWLTAIAIFMTACGGGGSSLEGIYSVDAWNQNSTSCADAGASVLTTRDPFVYVKKESLLGYGFLNVTGCTGVDECTTMANDEETIHLGYFTLDKGNDDDGWTGTASYASGPDLDGMCVGGVSNATLTVDGESAFAVRVEGIDVTFTPSGGQCETDAAEAAAVGQPCVRLETMHATFDSDY